MSSLQVGLSKSLPSLRTLVLSQNLVAELADLDPLIGFAKLTHVSFLECPVASKEVRTKPHELRYGRSIAKLMSFRTTATTSSGAVPKSASSISKKSKMPSAQKPKNFSVPSNRPQISPRASCLFDRTDLTLLRVL